MSYGYRYRERINEDDVPESKHTIFIRGLPGSMSTDAIKDYFEDKIGPVSFDFVKTSPDNARLFVAVRFETREDAKNAMKQFADSKILDHHCELSWFRDVRRFAEYQKAQGIYPSRGRGGFRGRGGYRGGYRGSYRDHRRGSRERSRSRSSRRSSPSRSRSRSRSDSERSRSRRRSRSRSERRSSSRDRRRSSSRDSAASKDSDYRRKDRKKSTSPKKEEKLRSRRSISKHSNISSDEGEVGSDGEKKNSDSHSPSPVPAPPVNNPPPPTIRVTIKTTKEDFPEIPVPPMQPVVNEPSHVSSIPAPIVAPVPAPVPPPSGLSIDQLKTSFSIGMDSDEPKIIQKTENKETIILGGQEDSTSKQSERRVVVVNLPPTPTSVTQYLQQQEAQANTPRGSFRPIGQSPAEEPQAKVARFEEPIPIPPPPTSEQYQMNTHPYNNWQPVDKKSNLFPNTSDSPALQKFNFRQDSPSLQRENGFGYKSAHKDDSKFPIQASLFSDVHMFQEQMLSGVKAAAQEETLGSLTLSTLTANNEENEMEKKCTREQKLASMSEIDLERFQIQKRKLENAFKGDCQTFTIVTKKLLSKDPTLERQLRMCLIETMEDLQKQMFEKIDSYLGI